MNKIEIRNEPLPDMGHDGGWSLRNLSEHPDFVPVDPDYVRFMQKAVEGRLGLGAADAYLPPQKEGIGMAVGYIQAPMIGSLVLREYQSGKSKAAYPVFDKAKFLVVDKAIGTDGSKDYMDTSLDWQEVALSQYGLWTKVDDLARSEAEGNLPPGVTLDDTSLELIQIPIATLKEKHQATALRTTGNYKSGFAKTLSGTAQWSHDDSNPVRDWRLMVRKCEKFGYGTPDIGWMAGDVQYALQNNKYIRESFKYTATKDSPADIISMATLVALFGMTLVVAKARSTASPIVSPTEIWGQDAGMACTGGGALVGVRLGVTVTHKKFPSVVMTRQPTSGGLGADRMDYADAWGIEICPGSDGAATSDAGGLFVNAAAEVLVTD